MIGIEMLKTKISEHNEGSLHKLVIEQKEMNRFSVKPFCLTDEFFLKAIL